MPPSKPPYRVPSLPEIDQVEKNGLTVASLFAGCGGSSLGYRLAGYRVVYANEFVDAAADTYAANASGGLTPDRADIRTVNGETILAAAGGELDVLDGSPPCASFSSSGKTSKKWGTVAKYSDTAQRTDDLFLEYARILREVRPRAFVAENVPGLIRGVSKGYFKVIFRELEDVGYRVEARLIDASYLGVPQARTRLIFVGTRSDTKAKPVFPTPLPYRYGTREAIRDLASPWADDGRAYDPETGARIDLEGTALGTEWKSAAKGREHRFFNLTVMRPDAPAPTVSASAGGRGTAGITHYEPRKLTLPELRRICSFPDDFVLTGTYAQRWERLGRAVPPFMMKGVATTLAEELSK